MTDPAAHDIALRRMRADEYDTFHERSLREYAEEIAANLGVEPEDTMDKARDIVGKLLPDGLDSPDQHLFVIERDGERVGELWFGLRDEPGGREAFGYDFWVRPELRDAGIGRRTMQLAAEEARSVGAVRLALNVFGENERPRHLYESFGFKVTSMNMVMPL